MARPPKYSEETKDAVLASLRAGATRTAAAGAAGISLDTLTRWMKGYAGFAECVTRAEAEAEIAMVKAIVDAAPKDWRAALEWLKRRRREEWGDNVHVGIDREIEDLLGQLFPGGSDLRT